MTIVPSDQSGHAIAHLVAAPLELRFGPELTRRLDQAHGRAAEPIEPVEVPELTQVPLHTAAVIVEFRLGVDIPT